MTTLSRAVSALTDALAELGNTVAAHGARLRTLERFAYSTVGAGISLGVASLASGHLHWS